jgi:hypothetical protein
MNATATPETSHAKSLRRAIERQLKDAQGWAWDADNQCGVFRGRFNTATIEVRAASFEVDVWVGRAPSVHRIRDKAGKPFLSSDYKTLGAALRNGRMFCNSNYSHV